MDSDSTAASSSIRLHRGPFWHYATRVVSLYGKQFIAWRKCLGANRYASDGQGVAAHLVALGARLDRRENERAGRPTWSDPGEQRWEGEGGSLRKPASPRAAA